MYKQLSLKGSISTLRIEDKDGVEDEGEVEDGEINYTGSFFSTRDKSVEGQKNSETTTIFDGKRTDTETIEELTEYFKIMCAGRRDTKTFGAMRDNIKDLNTNSSEMTEVLSKLGNLLSNLLTDRDSRTEENISELNDISSLS